MINGIQCMWILESEVPPHPGKQIVFNTERLEKDKFMSSDHPQA